MAFPTLSSVIGASKISTWSGDSLGSSVLENHAAHEAHLDWWHVLTQAAEGRRPRRNAIGVAHFNRNGANVTYILPCFWPCFANIYTKKHILANCIMIEPYSHCGQICHHFDSDMERTDLARDKTQSPCSSTLVMRVMIGKGSSQIQSPGTCVTVFFLANRLQER